MTYERRIGGGAATHASRLKSGLYVTTPAVSVANTVASNGTLVAMPLFLAAGGAIDRMAVDVTTAAALSVVRVGVYLDNGSWYPGSLLFEASNAGGSTYPLDSTTTGVKEVIVAQTLPPGLSWLACVGQGGSPQLRGISGAVAGVSTTALTAFSPNSYAQTGVTGALPPNFSTTVVAGNGQKVWVRGA